jgi:hypothetical protein
MWGPESSCRLAWVHCARPAVVHVRGGEWPTVMHQGFESSLKGRAQLQKLKAARMAVRQQVSSHGWTRSAPGPMMLFVSWEPSACRNLHFGRSSFMQKLLLII